jgi:hypothetical protein
MPIAVVHAALDMMPRLQAEEALHNAHVVSLGAGVMSPSNARAAAGRLQQHLADSGPRTRPRKASPSDLNAMGVGYKVVPRS